MSFPRYSAYKDSGVEWLGKLPAHWSVTKVKTLTSRISSGKTPLGGSETYVDEGVLFLRSQNVYDDGLRLDDAVFISESTDESMAGSRVQSGDVLLNITGASIGRSCVVPADFRPANVNQHVCAIRPTTGDVSPFLSWLFKSHPVKAQIDLAQNGAAREGLNFEQIGNISIPFAPPEEQAKLTDFLNRETAKIDALVAEQEQLITLLKEKRQAVISHAVTKGLDTSVPMKDSGVEWLREVPAHWDVKALKFVATVQTGIAKGKDNTGKKTVVVPYLRVANVQDGYLALDDMAEIEIPSFDLPRYLLRSGDVLMNEGGDFDKLGRGHVWRAEIEPCIHQNHVFAVRPHSVEPEWLNTVTSSSYAQFYFMSRSKQSTNLASISSTSIMELPVVLPPPSERKQSLVFLEHSTAQLKSLIEEAVLSIELLRERRAALIAAAVTGQIDVRGGG